jgi:predicted ATP-dependent endonuclease of OLD family
MHIHKIQITNFRLLKAVELLLEKQTTVIVGRNNSGKTSLTELFRRLLQDKSPTFQLEDFSLASHEDFWTAYLLLAKGEDQDKIRAALPIIEVRLTIRYEKPISDLGPLADFIIDLNPDCTDACIVIRYELKPGEMAAMFKEVAFDGKLSDTQKKIEFFRLIKERLSKCYTANVFAVDPNDPTNQKPVEPSHLRSLIQSGFINAQRGLDDISHRDKDVLGKILEGLLSNAAADSADANDRDIARKLEAAVKSIQQDIDAGFNTELVGLIPAFSLFGYPGFSDPGLLTETTLDVKRLLSDHTKVHYAGVNGINLPEAYNGLGARNLIFILLKLLEFFKSFKTLPTAPATHLIFIEEPEAHLHPQMQEVFIGKLAEIAKVFADKFNNKLPWPVQFVVTTHSSHLANKASFDSMRYCLAISDEHAGSVRSTIIKDLRQGLSSTEKSAREFVHKYMTLTRCDLLFADKAILIEGTTERILLPMMISQVDAKSGDKRTLSSQYISVVEVGGAYAHLFFGLLKFLELRTLIITDLDATKQNDDKKYIACKVTEGTHTSNACLKNWFSDPAISPDALIKKTDTEKTHELLRVTYEVPEKNGEPCGRSFEQAFILANMKLFGCDQVAAPESENITYDEAGRVEKKSDFAIEYGINKTDWVVPRYISDGLKWLAEGTRNLPPPSESPTVLPPPRRVKPKKSND